MFTRNEWRCRPYALFGFQYLEEDPRTNRIDDSLQIFTTICSNKLLKNTHLVLMLNKVSSITQKTSFRLSLPYLPFLDLSLQFPLSCFCSRHSSRCLMSPSCATLFHRFVDCSMQLGNGKY